MLAVQCAPELVLGQFKNLLLAFDVKIELSIPLVVSGNFLHITIKQGTSIFTACFPVDGSSVCLPRTGFLIQSIDFSKK
jgi:hypothetical protein